MMDSFSEACNLILLIVAALAVFLAMTYLENRQLNIGEYYVLVLFSTAGGMLMAAANDLIVLFIAIEILSVALYVLSGFARKEARSEEAALKYFLLGAFAAGFLLYGIALIYGGSAGADGNGGTTNLDCADRVSFSGLPQSCALCHVHVGRGAEFSSDWRSRRRWFRSICGRPTCTKARRPPLRHTWPAPRKSGRSERLCGCFTLCRPFRRTG